MTLYEFETECAKAEEVFADRPGDAGFVVSLPRRPGQRYWGGRRLRVARGLVGVVVGDSRDGSRINVSLKCSEVRRFIAKARKALA